MIKRTEIKDLETPKILKKQPYSNKGNVAFNDMKNVSADATPKPGMGKARGMGEAEFGGKFSGVY